MMMRSPRGWTRRAFLSRLGAAAGSATLYRAMAAMGLMALPGAYAGPPRLPPGSGKGQKVVIIGAGIGGFTAAYELGKAGYDCIILEASHRTGGRNFTVRRGTRIVESDSEQVCDFDEDASLYFNAGPARLPFHHEAILGYCREFGVALEPFVNDNRAAWFHSTKAFGGKPQRAGTVLTDARGMVSEMLAKATRKQALEQPLSAEDLDRLLGLLRSFGDLDDTLLYKGSLRAGPVGEAILAPGRGHPPIDLRELLRSDFWRYKMEFAEGWEQQPTMLQPVGGMDMIVKGFERALGSIVRTGAPVTRIVDGDRGVRVVYAHEGRAHEIKADWCIDCAPAHLVARMENNFSRAYREALASLETGKLFKIAFQARRRFWEEDDHIYGGISWTDQDVLQLWYPSHGYHAPKGIVLGAYQWDPQIGAAWGKLPLEQRLAKAVAEGEKIHPGYAALVEKGVSIAWEKVPYLEGCPAEWTEQGRAKHFPVLQKPDRRHYLVGDQMSYVGAWQEGAVRSAQLAVEHIHQRVTAGA